MEADDENTDNALNIIELGDLLRLLRDNDVHSFQGAGFTVVFNEREVYEGSGIAPTAAPAMVADDGHSTSNKRVNGFHDPALWMHQNGKVLTFKGTLE